MTGLQPSDFNRRMTSDAGDCAQPDPKGGDPPRMCYTPGVARVWRRGHHRRIRRTRARRGPSGDRTRDAAFFAKDYDAWADCWLHSEHVRRWSWYPIGGLTIEAGWTRLGALMRQAMQDFPEPLSVELRGRTSRFASPA